MRQRLIAMAVEWRNGCLTWPSLSQREGDDRTRHHWIDRGGSDVLSRTRCLVERTIDVHLVTMEQLDIDLLLGYNNTVSHVPLLLFLQLVQRCMIT
jgi:hypothetical protein